MKPGKRTPGGLGPKEGDFIPPQPGGDGKWRRVVLVQRGKVMGVEVWHGDPPTDPKAKKPKPEKKPKLPRWGPVRETLDLAPVVEKFLLWRFPPVVRPTAKGITQTRLDRYIRLALVQKQTNWYGDWGKSWGDLRANGVTDEELMAIVVNEFGCSRQRNPHDNRRVVIDFWRKGKKAWFVIGDHDDPDKIILTGANLLAAVRRAMRIPVLTGAEALSILAELDSINL